MLLLHGGAGWLGAVNQFMYSLEARPGVLDVTVCHGFPWADISIVGTTVVVTTENDAALAKAIGSEAGQVRKQSFLRYLMNVLIVLPREARDRHSDIGETHKRDCFLAVDLGP
jgi:microcystin degradation protein MlrC